jgi:TRAP-type C4-dicarboxylate transport system permease large subunit
MSLQKCPKCKKKIKFWKVYKKINKKRFYSDHLLTCHKCKAKLGIKLKQSSFWKSLLKAFAWMLLPILLIVSVALGNLNAFVAMWIVVVFHLLAMAYIIKTYKYNKVKK